MRESCATTLLVYSPDHHASHPTEPQCSYDPVEGLTLAPDIDPIEKIKQLEDQVCEYNLLPNSLYS